MFMALAFINILAEESLLSADFSLLIVLAIFVILVFVLNSLIFKPITEVLDQRERLTSGAMIEAKQAAQNYEKQLNNYEEKIRAARFESYQLLETQRKSALDERSKKLAVVKTQVTEKIDASKREIETDAQTARQRLETDARTMAESISRNLLKRPLGGTTS